MYLQLGHQAWTDAGMRAGSQPRPQPCAAPAEWCPVGPGSKQRLQPLSAVLSTATFGFSTETQLRAEREEGKGKFLPAGIRETSQFTHTMLRLRKSANV